MMRSDMPRQMAAPNAPEGRGYNREGFRGRGPLVARKPPVAQATPIQAPIEASSAVQPMPPVQAPGASRPSLPAQASDTARAAVARRPFKKGGMASVKGNGCCAKTKNCKMY